MKKFRQLLVLSSLFMATLFLLSCTGTNVKLSAAHLAASDAITIGTNGGLAGFSSSTIRVEADIFNELYTQYDVGAVIAFNYSVYGPADADEFRVTCEGEGITFLSPVEHRIGPKDGYKLEFYAPINGAGKIILTFTAFKSDNVLGDDKRSYLYWSSCDLGVFISATPRVPELVMAKAQYDTRKITSWDYFDIVYSQPFTLDTSLMNMLSLAASDKMEYSGYAAPYVEAVHNLLFGIESKAEIPSISETLKKIEDELGVDLNEEVVSDSSSGRNQLDSNVEISGTIMWKDNGQNIRPATNIRVEIVDVYTYVDMFGAHIVETVLGSTYTKATNATNAPKGSYTIDISDGASVREGGYDIFVRIVAEGSNVVVRPILDFFYIYQVNSGIYENIASIPPPPIDVTVDQAPNDSDANKAIQVQQAAALASEFARVINDDNYLDDVVIQFPSPYSLYLGAVYIEDNMYDHWDTIMHEYGHFVAEQLGTYFAIPAEHNAGSNFWNDNGWSKLRATRLAWQEGWASYYSIYAQRYMVNNNYIEAYNVAGGQLGDLTYNGWQGTNIEVRNYTSGEANEGAVTAVLWDITDGSNPAEPFDTLHRYFETIWSCLNNADCTTLDIFLDALYSELSDSEYTALGNILSEYKVSPLITVPADDVVLSATIAPTFTWNPGGCTNYPNTNFTLYIYKEESGELTNIFTSEPLTSLSYTLSQSTWDDIVAQYEADTLSWYVEGYNKLESPDTGPYPSNSMSFICSLQAPELIDAVPLNHNTIMLLWQEVPNATGYDIYRSNSLNGTYALISDSFEPYAPIPDVISYTNTGLTPGNTYYYKIKATTGQVESEYSNTLSAVAGYNFTYDINPDGSLTITGYTGSNLNVVIPSAINGQTVTAIGGDAFADCELTSILIPNSITSIGARAFQYTARIKSIVIPNSVTSIGEAAFYGSSITSIVLPNNLTEISANMFNSSKLKSIIIPNSVTSIGPGAFSNCTDLSDVTLSSNLINIASEAFSNTSSLTHITIPNGVTGIGEFAFAGSSLTSISLPSSLTTIDMGAFILSKLTSIVIPNNITSIGAHAFGSCYDLAAVTFSNGLTSIGDYAFGNCYSLENVSFPENIEYIGMFAFGNCTGLLSVSIVTSSPDCIIGNNAFAGCTSLASVTIDTVGSIGWFAFSDCDSLSQVDLANIENIGMQAFSECDSLKEVSISNVDIIGMYAFNVCTAIEDVTITDSGTIEMYAFYGCSDIVSASIDVYEIGDRAFLSCESLIDLYLADGIETIGDAAFQDCHSLVEVDIPNSVTQLGLMVFLNCTSLTQVVIPGSVLEIGFAAFAQCSTLYDVTLGEGIESIMGYAFYNCIALTQITIPISVTYIDETAFEGSGVEL